MTAALGNTWSHAVNTRLIVQYLDENFRQVLISKSPVAPFASFVYTIHAQGIVLQRHILQVKDTVETHPYRRFKFGQHFDLIESGMNVPVYSRTTCVVP